MKQNKFPLGNLPNLIAIDIETTGTKRTDERTDEIYSAAIAWSDYLSNTVLSAGFFLDRYTGDYSKDNKAFYEILKATLFNSGYKGTIIFHNMNFDLKLILLRYAPDIEFKTNNFCKLNDTVVISRLSKNNKLDSHTDPNKLSCHSLKYLAKEILYYEHTSFSDVVASGNIRLSNYNKLIKYNRLDAEITLKIYLHFKDSLSKKEWEYIQNIEVKHLLNIFSLNWNGVPIDKEFALSLNDKCMKCLLELEKKIFKAVGKSFNINSQQELASALFFNHHVKYIDRKEEKSVIFPPALTENDIIKIDLDTLETIKDRIEKTDPHNIHIETINNVMAYLEISKNMSHIQNLINYSIKIDSGYRIFPSFKTDTRTSRVKCSNPNLLGIPKDIFKKSVTDNIAEDIKNSSVRNLIKVPEDYIVLTIDISGLDLGVITDGTLQFDSNFLWKEFFKKYGEKAIDSHFSIMQIVDTNFFMEAFEEVQKLLNDDIMNYRVTKLDDDTIGFINPITEECISVSIPLEGKEAIIQKMKKVRTISKQLNLGVSYIMGAISFAVSLSKVLKRRVTAYEAQSLIYTFYENFPSIRLFQDYIGNKIYHNGYAVSTFGRKYYAETWDDLNEYHRIIKLSKTEDIYEFICLINNKYWYVKAKGWLKRKNDMIEDLKLIDKSFKFVFEEILVFEELDKQIFRPTKIRKKSKFRKKTEDNPEDITKYELSRIAITYEVDRGIKLGTSISSDAMNIIKTLINEGNYFIPEKYIKFYRVRLSNPSSNYFKFYRLLLRTVKKFFPVYCQGVASTIAKIIFIEIREKLEEKDLDAQIMLFIHDQWDLQVKKELEADVRQILIDSVESDKKPFDVKYTGECINNEQYFK